MAAPTEEEKERVSAPIYRSPLEKKYWKVGIPRSVWDLRSLSEIPFRNCPYRGSVNSGTVQRWQLKQIWLEPQYQLACIGSAGPQDAANDFIDHAMRAAYFVLMRLLEEFAIKVQVIDAAYEKPKLKKRVGAALIHNITPRSSTDKLERVRDLVLRSPLRYKPRIIVVTNSVNPEQFCKNKLGFIPTLACVADPIK